MTTMNCKRVETYQIGGTTIRVHEPDTTPAETKRILKEIQAVNWAIWQQIQRGKTVSELPVKEVI